MAVPGEPQFIYPVPEIPAFYGPWPVESLIEEAFVSLHEFPQSFIHEMTAVLVVKGSRELNFTIVFPKEREELCIADFHNALILISAKIFRIMDSFRQKNIQVSRIQLLNAIFEKESVR